MYLQMIIIPKRTNCWKTEALLYILLTQKVLKESGDMQDSP